MKSFAFFLLVALLGAFGNRLEAQSLAFSKAVYFDVDLEIAPFVVPYNTPFDTIITVPAGKVLKLESISAGYSSSSSSRYDPPSSNHYVFLNNSQIYGYVTTPNVSYPQVNYPIWLPAGSYELRFVYNSSSPSSSITRNYHYFLSALEFEVVP
ncbi:MAG: hypothetical protein H6581_16860 [Bacteroidia bacterium]|nr:hypothetical protein [Bacteroidia bacterium]